MLDFLWVSKGFNAICFYLQYSARFNAEAVRNFLYSLNNGTIAKKKFNCMYAILFYSQRKYIVAIHVFVSNCLAFALFGLVSYWLSMAIVLLLHVAITISISICIVSPTAKYKGRLGKTIVTTCNLGISESPFHDSSPADSRPSRLFARRFNCKCKFLFENEWLALFLFEFIFKVC